MSALAPAFIVDSMDFAIVGKPPSCGRSRLLVRSLSRKPARFAFRDGASVSNEFLLAWLLTVSVTLARNRRRIRWLRLACCKP
jgi:hypothetical protein